MNDTRFGLRGLHDRIHLGRAKGDVGTTTPTSSGGETSNLFPKSLRVMK